MAGAVTDPALIQRLEAELSRSQGQGAAAPAPAPQMAPQSEMGAPVSDPALIRRLEAAQSGFMDPQDGETWSDYENKTEYRKVGEKIQSRTRVSGSGQRDFSSTEGGAALMTRRANRTAEAQWQDIDPSKLDLQKVYAAARTQLPGISYGGPEGAGIGESALVAGKKVGLDLLTPDQKVQADFLAKHYTPERGYTIVPVENDRVMIVHKDKQSGKVTRQLINSDGLSVGDVVNAAPHVAAAAATGGASAAGGAASVVGRMLMQGMVAGGVTTAQEGALQAFGNERDVNYGRILTDAAGAVGGEALAGTINSAVRSNGVIRKAVENTIDFATGRLNSPPPMTQELADALTQAGVNPRQFARMNVEVQRNISRRLPAAQANGGQAADAANQTVRNIRDATDQGITPNHFQHGVNQDDKALFSEALNNRHGDPAQNLAQGLYQQTNREMHGAATRVQDNIAAVNGVRQSTPEASVTMDRLGQSLTRVRDAERQAAGQAVDNADRFHSVNSTDFNPPAMLDLQRRISQYVQGHGTTGTGFTDASPGGQALAVIDEFVNGGQRQVAGYTAPQMTTEQVRRSIRMAGGNDPVALGILDEFDNWLTHSLNTPGSTASRRAQQNLQLGADARRQYAEYVADFVDQRGTHRGDAIANVIEKHAANADALADSLLGRNNALQNPTSRDALNTLVKHMADNIANVPAAANQSRAAGTIARQPRAEAWNALRESAFNKIFRNPDGSLRASADIDKDIVRIRNSGSGREAMGRLYNGPENAAMIALSRVYRQLESAGPNAKIAGNSKRVGQYTYLGRASELGRSVSQFLGYVFRYHAVRGLHDSNAAAVLGNTIAMIAPGRIGPFLDNMLINGILRRGADPMAAFKGTRHQVSGAMSGTGSALAQALTLPFEPTTPEEKRLQTLLERARAKIRN